MTLQREVTDMTKIVRNLILAVFLLSLNTPLVMASSSSEQPLKMEWPHQGMFGTYDKAALQRGFQIYQENCSSCHAMKQLSYRNLNDIGFSKEDVKAIASEYTVMDGPNDDGEMFERNAKPSDRFISPFPNEKAARAANNGAMPPDMSLLVKARHGGEDYLYGLLTGYEDAPEDIELMEGMSWNKYFPGHQIAMAQPLYDGSITYADGTEASLDMAARDLVQFLAWASEPHLETRKQMGVKVTFFLLILFGFAYAAKRKLWADIH